MTSYILPQFSLKDLLERGVHFGHKSCRWNPKMKTYTYMVHDGVHIIDLPQTITALQKCLQAIFEAVKSGGRILFVGTKTQAKEPIREAAKKCGQYYVDHRWLGGTLTNWKTVSESIEKLKKLDILMASEEFLNYTKKEQLQFSRQKDKLERGLGGIKEMGDLPDMLFIIDVNQEKSAVKEAQKLKIPVVGIVDTNADPDGIQFVIPGNDDSSRAICLYCDVVCDAVLAGLQAEMAKSGKEVKIDAPDNSVLNSTLLEQLTERFQQASGSATNEEISQERSPSEPAENQPAEPSGKPTKPGKKL